MKKQNLIETKSFEFSKDVIHLYRKLKSRDEIDISRQLLRSGTSIGANVQEALAAFSKNDFIFKMVIASKEARETRYWLRLITETKMLEDDLSMHLNTVDELILILTSIVKTSQNCTAKASKTS